MTLTNTALHVPGFGQAHICKACCAVKHVRGRSAFYVIWDTGGTIQQYNEL